MDVLDYLEEIKIGVGYELDGQKLDLFPFGARAIERCQPIYESWKGWKKSTVGIKNYDELPKEAKQYLARLAELCRAPISLISTGAEREATIFCDHPI